MSGTVECTAAAADAAPPPESDGATDAQPDVAVAVDAGTLVPCTPSQPTRCVPCDGNGGGLCTPMQALVVARDIASGKVVASDRRLATVSCYECLLQFACINDDVFGDSNKDCGDLVGIQDAGSGAGESASQACLDVVTCGLATACEGPMAGGSSAAGIDTCYCGPSLTSAACSSATTQAGVCKASILKGLDEMTSPGAILTSLADPTLGTGMAMQMFQCAVGGDCAACWE